MNANIRIQWLHKKLTLKGYPNAQRLAERFGISHRQAQRDFDYLKKELQAPLAYDGSRKGFYYTAPFVLPVLLSSDNDDVYMPEVFNAQKEDLGADASVIQMQLPYSATVEIPNKLTALELSQYIVAKKPHHRYLCEFHSIEKFLGLLLSIDADVRLVEPYWLRERILRCARRIIANNDMPVPGGAPAQRRSAEAGGSPEISAEGADVSSADVSSADVSSVDASSADPAATDDTSEELIAMEFFPLPPESDQ